MSRRSWQPRDLPARYAEQALERQEAEVRARKSTGKPEARTEAYSVYKVVIPYELVSLNDWERMHFRQREAMKVGMADCIALLCKPRPRAPLEKCTISVTRVCRRRITDADNLTASLKPLLDALVRSRVIVDDSQEVIGTPSISQLTLKQAGVKQPETRVEVRLCTK